ncbi:MAG TPA: hypothetical protein VGK27_06025 [Candidatus Deferrimicrobiaceae bacterium]
MRRFVLLALGCLVLSPIAGCGGGNDNPAAAGTILVSQGIDNVTTTSATLRVAFSPGSASSTGWIEWDTDPSFPSPVETPHISLDNGTSPITVTATLAGLAPGRPYYYRAVASNGSAITRGDIDGFEPSPAGYSQLVVNSLEDPAEAPLGKMTLRAAVGLLDPDGVITFSPDLSGKAITLRIVGENHSVLKGETYDNNSVFVDFLDRDYGKSALYAVKNLTIDASGLPAGVTLRWGGDNAARARVLAVYGNLAMTNVAVTGGFSSADPIVVDNVASYTVARGGGIAVWGKATLDYCTLSGNRASGDMNGSRDRGAYGGGIYADTLELRNCILSGNTVDGYGAAGGGAYSVGGRDTWENSSLSQCAITGNRITGQHAYGGGVFSGGGGISYTNNMTLTNCTIARNVVEDNPAIADNPMAQFYYRGGGVYMSNGYLQICSCTIAENRVTGTPRSFRGKPNMGGGGIGATIGDAHTVEYIEIWHSIVAGNTLNGAADDLYTGSLLHFYSYGYNRLGKIDFSQMLVPIPEWTSLSRRHYPKAGDREDVVISSVLDLSSIGRHASIRSAGTDNGQLAVLWYAPGAGSTNAIPAGDYSVSFVNASASVPITFDNADAIYRGVEFLNDMLSRMRAYKGGILGSGFGTAPGPDSGIDWYYGASTWPSDQRNAPWINYWRGLDNEIGGRLGSVRLGDEFWGSLPESEQASDNVWIFTSTSTNWWLDPIRLVAIDQVGHTRTSGNQGAVGAIEAGGSDFWGKLLGLFR